jgi:glycosyltransferase involved in cell wall biosynthesis
VVAAYNEGPRIGRVLDELLSVAENIVVVDDGSRDNTREVVRLRPVWLVEHGINLGQGAAVQTGITFALSQGAGYVATFDADGQHQADDLRVMYQGLAARGADFALGSRFLGSAEGIPPLRRMVLRVAVWLTRLTLRVDISDVHNGIRVMTRKGGHCLRITSNRMEHASEILDQIVASGLPMTEVPVTIRYTAESLAKGQRTRSAVALGLKLLLDKVCR